MSLQMSLLRKPKLDRYESTYLLQLCSNFLFWVQMKRQNVAFTNNWSSWSRLFGLETQRWLSCLPHRRFSDYIFNVFPLWQPAVRSKENNKRRHVFPSIEKSLSISFFLIKFSFKERRTWGLKNGKTRS